MLTLLVSICSEPLVDEDNACPFLMRESMEKGGNSMLAWQVRVAPSSLVVAFLLASRSNAKSEMQLLQTHINISIILF